MFVCEREKLRARTRHGESETKRYEVVLIKLESSRAEREKKKEHQTKKDERMQKSKDRRERKGKRALLVSPPASLSVLFDINTC